MSECYELHFPYNLILLVWEYREKLAVDHMQKRPHFTVYIWSLPPSISTFDEGQ